VLQSADTLVALQPAEVEAVMAGVPEVHDAAAILQDAGTSSAVLVAYVSPAGANTDAVREACAARLPPYMVPQMFIALPTLPRLANGKVREAQ
jgi:acyl-CoA synthetase (AMP-forming)/AMP-acid ligase II